MTYEIRMRRGVSSTWAARNPVLAAGEPGLETDTGRFKVGDGATAWSQLPFFIDKSLIDDLIEDAALEGPPGPEGDSAYEVAVANGFVGNEAAWLTSLVGPSGTNGLDGMDGSDGNDGDIGLSAYEVAVDNGFVGTEEEWLASLIGPAGTNGTNGTNGVDGDDGDDGESVTVTLVDAVDWPPPADSNPLHLYFRVP